MSKPHLPDTASASESQTADLPPPSYTEATGTSSTPGPTSSSSSSVSASAPIIPLVTGESPLTSHLRTLPSRLRSSQHSHSTTQSSRETFLVSQCVPCIESFISNVVNLSRTPKVAELVLVPTEAMPAGNEGSWEEMTTSGRELTRRREEREDKGWELVGEKERREDGEVVKVACVAIAPAPAAVDKKGRPVCVNRKGSNQEPPPTRSGDYTFGEWGRFDTSSPSSSHSHAHLEPEEGWNWFTTPSLTRRIASLLRPEPTLARKTVQAAVESPESPTSSSSGGKNSGFASFFRRSSSKSQAESQAPTERVITPVRDGGVLKEDKIAMTVRAEEVTFRRENGFGVWESVTGWGVIVCIKVGRL